MGSSHDAANRASVHLPGYNANGSQDITLTYDAKNRLVSVGGAATASFSYDADGNRVKSALNGETVIYVGNLQKFNFL